MADSLNKENCMRIRQEFAFMQFRIKYSETDYSLSGNLLCLKPGAFIYNEDFSVIKKLISA